jgi:hypothetical protein
MRIAAGDNFPFAIEADVTNTRERTREALRVRSFMFNQEATAQRDLLTQVAVSAIPPDIREG